MTKPNAFTVPKGSTIARQAQAARNSAHAPSNASYIVVAPKHSYHATQKLMKASI